MGTLDVTSPTVTVPPVEHLISAPSLAQPVPAEARLQAPTHNAVRRRVCLPPDVELSVRVGGRDRFASVVNWAFVDCLRPNVIPA
jgi:hypothetical protein